MILFFINFLKVVQIVKNPNFGPSLWNFTSLEDFENFCYCYGGFSFQDTIFLMAEHTKACNDTDFCQTEKIREKDGIFVSP